MTLQSSSLYKSFMVHIRSKDVDQLTTNYNTDFTFNLQAPISRVNANQDIHISLSSAEIPNTIYQFNSNLDNLNLYLDGSSSFVLTPGNYDVFEMIALITASSFPYSATFDENTNKITLTNTDATSHVINFGDAESKGLAKALGFERVNETVGAGGNTTSDGSINFSVVHSIFLYSDLALSNVITSEAKGNYESILDKIPILVAPFDIIHYDPYQTAPFSSVLEAQQITKISISLRDQNGRLIQLNDARYEISLLIEIHNRPIIELQRPVTITEQSGRRRGLTLPNIDVPDVPDVPDEPIQEQVQAIPEQAIPTLQRTPSILPAELRQQIENIREPVSINTASVGNFSGLPPPEPTIQIKEPEEEMNYNNTDENLLDAILQAKVLALEK